MPFGARSWRHVETLGAIAAGGVLGAEARYGLGLMIPSTQWATLLANAIGCLLIGVLMTVLFDLTDPHRLVRPFAGIGVLGGFTTFSAYAVETVAMIDDGRLSAAVGYLVATPVIALISAWAGVALARSVRPQGGH